MSSEAMNKPHRVVRASAGAGKTYQLTTRYLGLLARHEPAEQILATTFTRKAAGEVLARVLGRLAGACADSEERHALGDALKPALEGALVSQAECVRMLRSIVDGMNRLSVGTIDGFFNRAARAMSVELGLPMDPRMIDERSPLARQLRNDAIHAVLGEQADRDGGIATLIELLRRLHHDTAQRSVADAIDGIVIQLSEAYRAYPDRALWDTLPTTGLLSQDLLTTALHDLEAMEPGLPVIKSGALNQRFAQAYQGLIADGYAGRWDAVMGNGLVKKVVANEDAYCGGEVTDDWRQAIKPFAFHAMAVRLGAIADQTRATYDLLALFDEQYKTMRFAQRVLLFSDLTHLLADELPTLGESGLEELYYRLDARVTHLLLDEFQDTSLRQWAVLKPFAEQITATSDGSRSLFCVGDTKQAIYGWRGGCAELFDEVQAMPGVLSETISKSWRSSQVVLDAVNRVFESLGTNAALQPCERAAMDWQHGFERHEAVHAELPGHVVLHTTASAAADDSATNASSEDDDDAAAPPDAHAHYTAEYIQRLVEAYPGRSVGVLMRSRTSARRLMFGLRSLGVHAAEEGGNPIDNAPAVSAVLSAIQFADHPGDKAARFHVSNTPIGEVLGLTMADPPERAGAVARGLRRALLDRGYAAVIADWMRALAPHCNAAALARLVQLIGLAEQFDDEDAPLRPGFFVEAARAARIDDPSPALVRVMTIHAAKGLEFDAVVLPELDGVLSTHDKNGLVVLHRASPIAPVRGIFRRQKTDAAALVPELQQAHDQQAHENRTEDLCLLYVAMTRARQSLHLLVKPLKQSMKKGMPTGQPTSAGLTNLSYAAVLRQAMRASANEGFDGDELLFEAGDQQWSSQSDGPIAPPMKAVVPEPVKPILLAKPAGAQRRSWVSTSPSQMHNAGSVTAADLLRLSPSGGRSYGTLMHKLFEQVGFIEDGLPSDAVLMQAVTPTPADVPDAAQLIAGFHRALAEPQVHAVMQRDGADELWRERPFVAHLNNQLVKGTFDRVHLWMQGGRIHRALLIDFKTDRVDDESIDAVAARYTDQVGLYREALAVMTGLKADAIDARLCFVGSGRVVSVD